MAQVVESMVNVPPRIYEAISGVMADIDAVGKNQKNKQQGFMYRGIDDVMNALAPALVKNKVFIVPEVTHEERTERKTDKGGVLFYSRLHITYRFYTTDGSHIEAKVIGEAMDGGDKATNKAMSVAYKYAAFQVFNIPTEELKEVNTGMDDPDAEVYNVAPEVMYVNKEHVATLRGAMEQKGITEEKVLKRYGNGAKAIEEITVEAFMRAMAALEKTQDKKQEEQEVDTKKTNFDL